MPSARGLAADRLAGLVGHRGETGVGGELVAGGEAAAVTDLGEDPGPGARTDPWQGLEQLAEGVGDEASSISPARASRRA